MAASRTATHRPGARTESAGPAFSRSAVDLDGFRRSIVEVGLIGEEELARFVVAGDEVPRLAGALIRAGRLTAYQAAALAQGKAGGLVIGEYLVTDKLGQGGMGVVFKACHRPTGHVVALKILPPSFGRDPGAVKRFRREVEVASRLDHPNVVAILDASEARGVHFLTMEYIAGYDLDRLVVDGGPLPIDLALHCTIHAARGLAAAHAQGIIHRDVKPANVMLDEAGSVRLLDLGLARVVEAGNLIGDSPIGSLTQSGAYMGTVDFMAPEQADDPRKVDHRADIYSLGCTLYFLLTGRPPFLADTVFKRLMAHQERPAPSLRAARPEVPERLEAAYLQMMAKRPDDRPDDMGDVIDRLEACRSSPEDEEEARSGLTTFARRAFKRAAPRGRDRGPDASIFARRPPAEGPRFDPDLRFEDVVMDFREEVHTGPLPEEKLPPIAPRPLPERVVRRRRRVRVPYGPIGLAMIGLAAAGWFAFRPRIGGDGPGPAPSAAVSVVAAAGALGVRDPAPADRPAPRRPPAPPAFRTLFNGKDLGGWAGAVDDFEVRDGILRARTRKTTVIYTPEEYSDFVARVEYRLTPRANGGMAIRYPGAGLPASAGMCEIEIVDEASYPIEDPRQATGSAYGMVAARRGRLRPAGEWNTQVVTVRGSTLRVELNGDVVLDADLARVDDFLPEVDHPGKDRRSGRFGLTNVNEPVEYRSVEIRRLDGPGDAGDPAATATASGRLFRFNGRDLDGWSGDRVDYQVRGGLLSCKPGKQAVIYEPVERRDFAARVEFRLAPGAEAGLMIRYPGEVSYEEASTRSMCEIQILDDTHAAYAGLDARVHNGSAWGIAAARRGHLRPPGEWNVEEVTVRGSTVRVELNGTVILDADLAPIREFAKGRPHPGKDRAAGFFGLQGGPGTGQGNVEFRKVEIRDLPPTPTTGRSGRPRTPF